MLNNNAQPAANEPTMDLADVDGSIHDAALAMPDLDIDDPAQAGPHPGDAARNVNGQFRPADGKPAAKKVAMPNPAEVANDPDGDAEAAEEASDVADEFFELPPEKEGEKPRRLKASEVWEKAQRADALEQQLVEARRTVVPPAAFDEQLMQLITAQQNTLQQLQMYEQMLHPEQPDIELINEESPRYNPGLYQRQYAMAQQKASQVSRIRAQMEAVDQDRKQRVAAYERLQFARGREALGQLWPEVVADDGKEAARVRSEVAEYYGRHGVTPEVMASITNPGFYAVLKDALAYRRGLRAKETAVKVVRSKPKLVRGAARGPSNAKAAAYHNGMQRLVRSNTIEDAADALEGLI